MLIKEKNKKLYIDNKNQVYLETYKEIFKIDKTNITPNTGFKPFRDTTHKFFDDKFILARGRSLFTYKDTSMTVKLDESKFYCKSILDFLLIGSKIFVLLEKPNGKIHLKEKNSDEVILEINPTKKFVFTFFENNLIYYDGQNIKIYNLETEKTKKLFKKNSCLRLVANKDYIVTCDNTIICIYSMRLKSTKILHYHSKNIIFLKLSNDSNNLYSVCKENKILKYDIENDIKKVILNFHFDFLDFIERPDVIYVLTTNFLYVYDRGSDSILSQEFSFDKDVSFIGVLDENTNFIDLTEESDIIPRKNNDSKRVRLTDLSTENSKNIKNRDDSTYLVFLKENLFVFLDCITLKYKTIFSETKQIKKAFVKENCLFCIEKISFEGKKSESYIFKAYSVFKNTFKILTEFKLNINIDNIRDIIMVDEKIYFYSYDDMIYCLEKSGMFNSAKNNSKCLGRSGKNIIYIKENIIYDGNGSIIDFKDSDREKFYEPVQSLMTYKDKIACIGKNKMIYIGKVNGDVIELEISHKEELSNKSSEICLFNGNNLVIKVKKRSNKSLALNYTFDGNDFQDIKKGFSELPNEPIDIINENLYLYKGCEIKKFEWKETDTN